MKSLRPETAAAIAAVERGLALARTGVGTSDIGSKGPRDLVTTADVAVEDAVRASLGQDAGLPLIGEERGGEAPDGSPHWLVDPICGTGNFAFGIPLYSVNLALVEEGRISVAAVGDGSTGEIAFAERGRGAWALEDGGRRRLTVGHEGRAVVIEEGRSRDDRRARAARFMADAIRSDRWDVLSLSTTLSLTYVAMGRVAAYVLFAASALHAGAGSLLAAEAGATVSDIDGRPFTLRSDSIVASADPHLHEDLLRLLRDGDGNGLG